MDEKPQRIVTIHIASDADTDEEAEQEVIDLMEKLGFKVGEAYVESDGDDGEDSEDTTEFRDVGGQG